MKKFEFIQYIPTPDDAKCLGIAEIRMYFLQEEHERFPTYGVERFKVMKNEKGGWYFVTASVKFPEEYGGYKPSFYLDSNEVQSKLYDLIRIGIKEQMDRSPAQETIRIQPGSNISTPGNQPPCQNKQVQQNTKYKEKEDNEDTMPF